PAATEKSSVAVGHSSGAAGQFVSVGLPRRAPAAPRNRALACILHAPSALCRERDESQPPRIARLISIRELRSRRSAKFVTGIEWRARQDSNLRPTAPEAVALSS